MLALGYDALTSCGLRHSARVTMLSQPSYCDLAALFPYGRHGRQIAFDHARADDDHRSNMHNSKYWKTEPERQTRLRGLTIADGVVLASGIGGRVLPRPWRGKNDAADAEAICEAVTRPSMRFVPVKSTEQQGVLVLHRTRELLVRQRTMLVNGLRGHMAEFGIIAPQGIQRVDALVAMLKDDRTGIPQMARQALAAVVAQLANLSASIRRLDKRIVAWCRANDAARRLATIPGIGPITASALAAHHHGSDDGSDPADILRRGARPRAATQHISDGRPGETRPDSPTRAINIRANSSSSWVPPR